MRQLLRFEGKDLVRVNSTLARGIFVIGAGALLAVASGLGAHHGAVRAQERPEVRALWVTRGALTSPASISAMVAQARATGFNTLLVQVRARGDAYYLDGIEPRAASLAAQPESFDPLATTLSLAHRDGLRVHAWVNISLVSSAVDVPTARTHIVLRHPEWLMVPRALAHEMLLIDPKSQLYVDKLARWARSASDDVEGLYLSPIPVGAADHTVEVIADLAERYPLDGVHLDYARYPTDDFDWSREALAEFDAAMANRPSPSALPEASPRDVAALVGAAEANMDRWREFRRTRLTDLVARLSHAIKARIPDALVSAAVPPDAGQAASLRLQDWRVWLDRGLIDVVCPMAYATDTPAFTAQVESARKAAGDRPMWVGIGVYRISSAQAVENINVARRLGARGIVLFSYDSVAGSSGPSVYLTSLSRSAFVE